MVENVQRRELAKMKKNKEFLYLVLAILCVWCPLFMGAWDKDKPASSTSMRNSNPQILANWSALESGFGAFHEYSTGGTNSGENTKIKFNTPISTPTNAANKSWLYEKDVSAVVELHWLDESGNELQMTSGGDLYSSAGLTVTGASTFNGSITLGAGDDLIGSSTSDITINTDKFTVAGDTGNTVIAGSLNPTSYVTTNGGFLDEDALGSDAADKVASQQSIKAYADALGGSGEGFIKGWVSFASNGTIADSFNVTSVNRDSAGVYTITWDTNFANANYVVVGTNVVGPAGGFFILSKAVGSAVVNTRNSAHNSADAACSVIAIGDQ